MLNDLKRLVESVLITEMDEKFIDMIKNKLDYDYDTIVDKLPFRDIFGDKLRIVIPYYNDPTIQELIASLSNNIKGFDGIDLEKGEIKRKVKLDPKYGRGDSTIQTISIGKALKGSSIEPERKKKLLDWFATNKDKLNVRDDDYYIVLSRSPIDIVRMSDHRNITSCHSKGGQYFNCALQEAVTGGAIAYLIRKHDYDHMMNYFGEEGFQEEDLFSDKDRGVGHIVPISRLRISRFQIGLDDTDVAIPVDSVYGERVPGFFVSVLNWVRNKQRNVISDEEVLSKAADYIQTRGGSYHDVDSIYMLATYLDKHPDDIRYDFTSDHSREDKSSESEFMDVFEDDVNELLGEYSFEHTSVDTYFDDSEGTPYVMITGFVKYKLIEKYPKLDIDEIEQAFEGVPDMDDSYYIEKYINNGLILSELLDTIKNNVQYDGLEFQGIRFDDGYLHITVAPRNGDALFDVSEVRKFLNDLNDFDGRYDEHINEIIMKLYEADLIKVGKLWDQYRTDDDLEPDWTYFYIDYEDSTPTSIVARYTFDLGEGRNVYELFGYDDSNVLSSVKSMILDVYKPLPPKNDEDQLSFSKFFESYTIKNLPYKLEFNGNSLYITSDDTEDEFFNFVSQVDDLIPHIVRILNIAFEIKRGQSYKDFVENNKNNRNVMVYAKYLKPFFSNP